MIFDFDQALPSSSSTKYDICIAGGGVAGIVLAITLASRGKRIALLEAGGVDLSVKSQELYTGENIGLEYFGLDECRLRYLGGTSNHWGGRCRPLDAHDFEQRDYIADSGWPIDIGDLQPYLAEARGVLELEDFPSETPLVGSNGKLIEPLFRFSQLGYHRSGKSRVSLQEKYHDQLRASEAVDVFLNANLMDIELDSDKGRISGFIFRGYNANAKPNKIVGDQYVLALGGIENARMLLNANRQMTHGIGNENDLVGRYFMEHPIRAAGWYVADSTRTRYGSGVQLISPSARMQVSSGIGSATFEFRKLDSLGDGGIVDGAKGLIRHAACANDTIREFVTSARPLRCRPNVSGIVVAEIEQAPNRNSRVILSGQKDRFGLRRPALDWQLLPIDTKTIHASAMEIATYFARQDIGRMKLYSWMFNQNDEAFPEFDDNEIVRMAQRHHMGTTRMASTKREGVVDRDCRVFDVANLYIAGSSVFTTSGRANPTLTIVQLALRLRDHIAKL